MKIFVFMLLSFAALSTYAQTYDGPKDPTMYREPKDVLCSAIPDFPKGANLEFPQKASVGNLQDGITLSMPLGVDANIIFMGMTLTGKDKLEGEFILIKGLVSLPVAGNNVSKINLPAYHGKTTCVVKSWYK